MRPVILADTNRDGYIDVTGDSDAIGKDTWTEEHGALFLANIGDSDLRCSRLISTDPLDFIPDKDLDKCHDASDNEQRNPKYLAPLVTLPVTNISNSASGSVTILGDGAASKVRVFQQTEHGWYFIHANHSFSARELKSGLKLGIDARDIRRPSVWDGRVQLQFSVRDHLETAHDLVSLRVAPVLTHHHIQSATEVITVQPRGDERRLEFVKNLSQNVERAGIEKPLYLLSRGDVWTQDHFEPAYMSIPGPSGPITIRVIIRSPNSLPAGQVAFSELRSDTVGAIQFLSEQTDTDIDRDSMGNLETIPPHEYHGKVYPAGRTIMGSRYGQKPSLVGFLTAQEIQPPVEVDTSWLIVGHVDEFMQFLPSQSDRGWVMAVHDPLSALKILQKAQNDGHGSVKAVSRPRLPVDERGSHVNQTVPTTTIDGVLSMPDFARVQEYVARQIQRNVEIVKGEVGLSDEEILRIPGLFYNESMTGPRPFQNVSILPDIAQELESLKTLETAFRVSALYPSAVNGVLLSSTQYLAPNPWGPSIDGRDVLREGILSAYAGANLTVMFMDDWFSHHTDLGDIHCGTNIFRDCSPQWW